MNTRGDRRPVSTTGDRRDDTTGLRTSLRALAMVAGTAGVAAALAFPAAASAAGPAAQQRPIEAGLAAGGAGWAQDWGWRTDWYHPEWGSGWTTATPHRAGFRRWGGLRRSTGCRRLAGPHPRATPRLRAGEDRAAVLCSTSSTRGAASSRDRVTMSRRRLPRRPASGRRPRAAGPTSPRAQIRRSLTSANWSSRERFLDRSSAASVLRSATSPAFPAASGA